MALDAQPPGTYDPAIQQWRESATLNVNRLAFERWLVDHEQAEHAPVSQPRGEFTFIVGKETPCSRP